MIFRILQFSLEQRAAVLLGVTLLIAFGLYSARELPIDAVPDITSPQVQINTEVNALAPEEVEQRVTRVLEMVLSGLPGVTEMRSLTKYGLSQITLQFNDGTDIYRCRQLVSERLQGALDQLPTGAAPHLAPISTGLGEILYYTVSWKTNAPSRPQQTFDRLLELHEIHEYIIKPFLRATPGIAEINSIGGHERQVVIQPDLAKLSAANLTFSELAEIIASNTENAGGGIIHQGDRKLVVRAASKAQTVEELAGLPVKFTGAVQPLRVRDLAEVKIGSQVRTGAATVNGEETLLGTVMMLAGENSRVVAHRVGARINALRERLPQGIDFQVQYDRANLVDHTIATVKRNLFEGAIFVGAILLLLLGNWKAALIVASAIPLSFLCALVGMTHLGLSGNLMSLGAVDFGLIIDGAVVMVENIVAQLAHQQKKHGRTLTSQERVRTVLSASRQVANPMFFGVLIITVVYLPLLTLSGIEGKMFRPMAITVMLALGGALVLAVTLMPVLCSIFLTGHLREEDNAAVRLLKRIYQPTLRWAISHRGIVAAAGVAGFALAVGVLFRLGSEFVPKLDEGSTTMMLYRPVGQSLEATIEQQIAIETQLLKQFPEIDSLFSRIGTSEVATDPMPPNEADFYIQYRPRSEWRKVEGQLPLKSDLAEQISQSIRQMQTNTEVLVAQPIEMRFKEMLEGVRADLAVKVFGPDFDVLEKLAGELKQLLLQQPGVGEVEFETDGRAPMLTLSVRREELAKYNLSASALNNTVATAVAGRSVGTLPHESHVHDIVVRMRNEERDQFDVLKSLPVRVGEYGSLPLGRLTDFTTVENVEPIRHDAGKRRAALMVNLKTRDVEGFVRRAQEEIQKKVVVPPGYSVEFGGQFEHLVEARARLMLVVPAVLVLIFGLTFIAFGSLRQTLLIYSGIPLAVTGGVLALWLRDMPFSITAAVGFIALSGVAVLNGVVLVSQFNQLREEGLAPLDAVLEGSMTRLRPVFMTALVASLGFLPMALSHGAGAEVQRPLATVVIGGIASSTLLTLIVLPSLYAWVERARPLNPQDNGSQAIPKPAD